MKTVNDPRHIAREKKFKKLFSYSFGQSNFAHTNQEDISQILNNLTKIDHKIQTAAPEWPIERLNKVDLAILRLSVFELLIEANHPPKVIIDEAIELGKSFGSDSTAKFVNGVLGTLLKEKESN